MTATELEPSRLTAEEQALLPVRRRRRGTTPSTAGTCRKKLFTDDEVDALVAASERYYDGERDRRLPVRPPKLAYWDPSKGPVQRHNDYVHYESDGARARSCASR